MYASWILSIEMYSYKQVYGIVRYQAHKEEISINLNTLVNWSIGGYYILFKTVKKKNSDNNIVKVFVFYRLTIYYFQTKSTIANCEAWFTTHPCGPGNELLHKPVYLNTFQYLESNLQT